MDTLGGGAPRAPESMLDFETRSITLTKAQWLVLDLLAESIADADVQQFLARLGNGEWDLTDSSNAIASESWTFMPGAIL